jgi:hypothetical protein
MRYIWGLLSRVSGTDLPRLLARSYRAFAHHTRCPSVASQDVFSGGAGPCSSRSSTTSRAVHTLAPFVQKFWEEVSLLSRFEGGLTWGGRLGRTSGVTDQNNAFLAGYNAVDGFLTVVQPDHSFRLGTFAVGAGPAVDPVIGGSTLASARVRSEGGLNASLTFGYGTASNPVQTSGRAGYSVALFGEAYAGPKWAWVGGRWTESLALGSL